MVYGTPLPAVLPGPALSDREAVIDAVYRAFASLDHADEPLLRSSCSDEIITDIVGKQTQGYPELVSKVWEHIAKKLDTLHHLTSLRVAIDTPTTARVTFVCQAMHTKLGLGWESGQNDTKWLSAAHWTCDAVKVDGVWKLSSMAAKTVWSEGNRAVMMGA